MSVARFLALAVAALAIASCGRRAAPPAGKQQQSSTGPSGRSVRPVYPYSVIPGGVESAADVQRASAEDPAIAAHYRDLDTRSLRPQRLARDEFAYVSYRRSGRIYWTSRPVRLAAGETVLADSAKACVRGRCGNRIAYTPQRPVIENRRDEPADDALITPVPLSGVPYDVSVAVPPVPPFGSPGTNPSTPADLSIPPGAPASAESSSTEPAMAAFFPPAWTGGAPASWMTPPERIPNPPGAIVVPPPGLVDTQVFPTVPGGRVEILPPDTVRVTPVTVSSEPPAGGGGIFVEAGTTGTVLLPTISGGDGNGGGGTPATPGEPLPPGEYQGGEPGSPTVPGHPGNPGNPQVPSDPPPPPVHPTPEPSTGILVAAGVAATIAKILRARG